MLIGDQFLEVVSPTRDGTTAGRLLERRARDDGNGDGGYMAIYEVDDLDARVEHVQAAGVRVVWSIDLPTIRARHLHPRDVGGALVSIDQPARRGEWPWGGPTWRAHDGNGVVSAIAGVSVGAADPAGDARPVGRARSGPRGAVRPGERAGRGHRRARPRRDRPRSRRRDDGALRRRSSIAASCDGSGGVSRRRPARARRRRSVRGRGHGRSSRAADVDQPAARRPAPSPRV